MKYVTPDTDWSKLTLGERIKHLEIEGYVVVPDILSPEHVKKLKAETIKLETNHTDYSERQRILKDRNLEYKGGVFTDLVAHPPTIAFLKELCGDEIIMMSYSYSRSEPGHPGINFHSDAMSYGSHHFGHSLSCPKMLRVLYYLDDLTPEVSPFRIIPRTHLSFHNQANPYLRYKEHPEQVMVTCKAGSAVFFNMYCFHGNFPNVGDRPREVLLISYRPSWAGPINEIESRDPEKVATLPPEIQALMGDLNTRIWKPDAGNIHPDMPSEATGINPSRWDRD